MKSAQFARQYWGLIAGIALTLVLQLALVARSPIIAKDGIRYVDTAKALAKDPLLVLKSEDQPPGYPALVLMGRRCFAAFKAQGLSGWILGGRLVTGLFGLFAVILFWYLTRLAFDTRTAAVAVLVVAVLPTFRESASDVLRDTPHLALFLLSASFLIWHLKTGKQFSLGLAGTLSGLAYWIRPEGLTVWAAGSLLLILGRKEPPAGSRPVLFRLAAFTLPVAFLVLPGPILMHTLGSRGVLALAGKGDWIGSILAHPLTTIACIAADISQDFAHGLRYVLLPVLALGVLGRGRLRADPVVARVAFALIVTHAVLLVGFHLVLGYTSSRYVMAPIALSIPWIAAGAVHLSELPGSIGPGLPGAHYLRKHPTGLLVLLVLTLVAGMTPRTLRPLHRHRKELVAVAQWLKHQAAGGDCVVSNSPYVPFYAELPGAAIGNLSPPCPCRFVVLDTKDTEYEPGWLSMLSGSHRRMDVPLPAVKEGRIVVMEQGL